jgi:hypothetical protein
MYSGGPNLDQPTAWRQVEETARTPEVPDVETLLALLARAGALVGRRAWEPLGFVRSRDYAVEPLWPSGGANDGTGTRARGPGRERPTGCASSSRSRPTGRGSG